MKNNKISGVAARKKRRAIAMYARRNDKQVRTLKFPLDNSETVLPEFEEVASLYKTTEGVARGSLLGVLCATHLSGFRFFSNTDQCAAFQSKDQLPTNEFVKQWAKSVGESYLKFTPSAIINFLRKPPRKVKGKAPTYETKPIAAGLYEIATGKRLDTANDSNKNMVRFLRVLETNLIDTFPERSQVSENIEQTLRIFDAVAASLNMSLPSLESSNKNIKPASPDGTSIAFDANLLSADISQDSDIVLHQVVAQKLKMIRGGSAESVKELRTSVQHEITTRTNNALNWLFGRGLLYWKKSSIEKICTDYAIPKEETQRILVLKQYFDAVEKDSVFGSKNYASFRSSVGGKVDSWIANYLNRLDELEVAIKDMEAFSLPTSLGTEEAAGFFSGLLNTSASQIVGMIAGLLSDAAGASKCIGVLAGKSNMLPSPQDIEFIEAFSKRMDGLHGILMQLLNQIKMISESTGHSDAELAKQCEFKIPSWLKALPQVPQISGGLPSIQDEIDEDLIAFKSLRSQAQGQIKRVGQWLEKHGENTDVIRVISEQESRKLAQRDNQEPSPKAAELQARRFLLHRFSRLAINGGDDCKEIVGNMLSGLFKNKKELNLLLHNNKGAIYRSPFSPARHQAYELDEPVLLTTDLEMMFKNALGAIATKAIKAQNKTVYRDWVRMENLTHNLTLYRLPENIKASLLELDQLTEHCFVPSHLLAILQQENISRESFVRAFNLYSSEMMGKIAMLFRTSFILKTHFVRVGKNELVYVAKPETSSGPWNPPGQLVNSTKPIGEFLRLHCDPSQKFSDRRRLDEITKLKEFDGKKSANGVTAYLKQAPHDWYLDLGLTVQSANEDIKGIKFGKKGYKKKLRQLAHPARLRGASSYKNVIDRWIDYPHLSLGDYNLIVSRAYQQSISFDMDGNCSEVQIKPEETSWEVAIPVTDSTPTPIDKDNHPLGDTIIGIDLGEAGIGFAVFDVADLDAETINSAKPLKSGTIAVRSSRRLIHRVKHYRNKIQPNQRFQQRGSTALQSLRENVIGDICHEIDSLMVQYRGIPVLESSVRNLASGAAQLKLVYDQILNRYVSSDIDAHKKIKKHHWCGGEKWDHPTLFQRTMVKNREGKWELSKKIKALVMHPGCSVHPAGTSQVCSVCHRNPYPLIQQHFLDDKSRIPVEKIDGTSVVLMVNGDRIRLMSRKHSEASPEIRHREQRRNRHEKLNPEFKYPITHNTVTEKELRNLIKRQLRQPQRSTRSRDTTQSVYHCVFDDCQSHMHADENAAINICRKWVRDRGITSPPP